MNVSLIVLGIFVFLVLATLSAGIKIVPQGYNWTVERFGRYTRTLAPGLNLLIPYVDRVGHKIIMMPLEAGSLIGSVAGMAELFKDGKGHK